MIHAAGLTKTYSADNDTITAVESLDLQVERGEIFGFLGPNGAGKSTTIDMILGLTSPTDGSISVLGRDPRGDRETLGGRIGVLPEGLGLYTRLTGRRNLEFAIRWMGADDDPDGLLERVGLDTADAARPVGEYSTGMRQRLALAMTLVGNPQLIVLDEPSSGLDPNGIRRLRDIVREERERGATVFFSSHLLDQVEAVADRIGILNDGELVAVDDIAGLRRTVGSGAELELRVEGSIDTELTRVPGVIEWEHADGILRVQTGDPRAKARVITHLTEHGTPVLDVDSAEASLEDVFTAYTTDDTAARRNGRGEADPTEVSIR